MQVLVVITPFGEYGRGSRISGKTRIEDILDGPHADHVVVADHDAAPADQEHETTEQE